MDKDELKGVAQQFYALGFPVNLIALIGAFAVGMAIFQGDISASNKRLILGAFLISFSIFAWHLPQIYSVGLISEGKAHRFFSLAALVWTLIFGGATFYFGRLLLRILTQ